MASLAAMLVVVGLAPGPSRAAHDRVVSAVPASTPSVMDGSVRAVVQIGNRMIVGGGFTKVAPRPSDPTTARTHLFAFDRGTGAITSFNPRLDGTVTDLLPGPSPDTVFVSGAFNTVNGERAPKVVLLDTRTGQRIPSFAPAAPNGVVNALERRGDRLYLGGNFTTVGGQPRGGLATLSASSGALSPYVTNQVAQRHNDTGTGAQGAVGVRDLALTPDGTRLVAIGNFKRVDGALRDQLVVLDQQTASSVVAPDWNTNRYQPYCFNWSYDTYVRGLSMSPDGSYFVVTTTGGHNPGTLCDTAARFETRAFGQDIQPTWVTDSGGDTLWGVAVTEKAVYVGGHQRWLNNSRGSDYPGPGAVPRAGLAALSTRTGVPLRWNPGRNPRGAAVYTLYPTPDGIWMGSDTEFIGPSYDYRRPRLAMFPLAGGAAEAADTTAGIPGTAYVGGGRSSAATGLARSMLSTAGAAPLSSVDGGGVDWAAVRGSFLAGGRLYYGTSSGQFHSRTFADGRLGPATVINPYHDPLWSGVNTGSGQTYDGRDNDLYAQFPSVTGMAYADGRLYYTRQGDPNLYWRWFNVDSGIIGEVPFTANGGRSWTGTGGMFAADGRLYFVTQADGNLHSIPLGPGGPNGTATVVDGPAVSGNDWRGSALFLAPAPAPNEPPTAAITSSCSGLTCQFDGRASADRDGSITAYTWELGDGTTASGPVVTRTYAQAGTYTVRLTVTDDDGATTTTSRAVTVSDPSAGGVSFVGADAASRNASTVSVTVPSTVEEGDVLVLTAAMSSAESWSAPPGWVERGARSVGSLDSVVWTKVATAGDAGTSATVAMEATHKAALTVAAYDGVDPANPVAAIASAVSSNTTAHTTPTVTAPAGSWLASFWTDKGPSTAAWTTPNAVTRRAAAFSDGTGRVSGLVADSGGPVSGTTGGLTATTDATSSLGISWSVALAEE